MSTPRAFGQNGQALYSNITQPTALNLQWTVTPTNGLGVTSLLSNGYVNNVFMHTSTTPTANNGYTNPNPANGYALIQLKQNILKFLGAQASMTVPTATSTAIDTAALTVGNAYVITIVGDETLANWQYIGLPVGVTPAVGVSFIATHTGVSGSPGTSTSRVQVPGTSGIVGVEVVGNPVLSANSAVASNSGMWVMLKFNGSSTALGAYTPAGTIAMGAYTPAGTVAAPVLTMASYTPAGTNDGASPPIFTGTPATLTGTNTAPTFTGSAASLTGTFTGTAASLTGTTTLAAAAPGTGSIVKAQLWFDASSVTIDGL